MVQCLCNSLKSNVEWKFCRNHNLGEDESPNDDVQSRAERLMENGLSMVALPTKELTSKPTWSRIKHDTDSSSAL